MLNSGDVVEIDLGSPQGMKAGFSRPAVVVTAQRILDGEPTVVQIVPLTTTLRPFGAEVRVPPDQGNGLSHTSSAQCQHIRAVASQRVRATSGNVGPLVLAQIRDTIALIVDAA